MSTSEERRINAERAERERLGLIGQVIILFGDGLKNDQIAKRLNVPESTVKTIVDGLHLKRF